MTNIFSNYTNELISFPCSGEEDYAKCCIEYITDWVMCLIASIDPAAATCFGRCVDPKNQSDKAEYYDNNT